MPAKLVLLPIFLLAGLFSAGFILAADISIEPLKDQLSGPDDEYIANILLNINSPDDTQYYLRGVFFQPDTTDYCGYTWNGNDWYRGPIKDEGWKNFLPITVKEGSWSGELKAKIDIGDSGCKSSGTYSFKVLRYTLNSYSPGNDNVEVRSVSVVLPTLTPTCSPTIKPTVTVKPTNTPKPTSTPKPASTPKSTNTPFPANTPAATLNKLIAVSEKDITRTTISDESETDMSTDSSPAVLAVESDNELSSKSSSSSSGQNNNLKIISITMALVGAGLATLTGALVYAKMRSNYETG